MTDTYALRVEANSKAAQKARREQEKRAIDAKIERLRTARDRVATEKQVIKDLKSAIRKQEKPDDAWKGNKRNRYHDYVSGDFRSYYDTYYNKTDAVHDAIIRKIADLQNQSRDLGGIIGWLASAINSLWADIKAALN